MCKADRESGQSILIIAIIVMVLLALVALVVDVGNAYAHRRMVQNAVDAAALAGARVLAFRGSKGTVETVTHMEVAAAVFTYAEENGLVQDAVRPELILDNGTRTPLLIHANKGIPMSVVGVWVEGDLPFNTYFANLLGFPTMQVTADAAAYHITGPCRTECLFPVIAEEKTLLADCPSESTDEYCVLWDQKTKLAPGNFGWLYWVDAEGEVRGDPPQGPEVPTLERNLDVDCDSGVWGVDDEVRGNVGVNFQPVLDLLKPYIECDGCSVTIPLFSDVREEGNNTLFWISGFGRFVLTCAHASQTQYVERWIGACEEAIGDNPNLDKNSKFLVGKLEEYTLETGMDGGCADTGLSGVSFRPPKSLWMPESSEDE